MVDSGVVRSKRMQMALILAALILCLSAGMRIGVQGTEGFARVVGLALVIALCVGIMIRPKWGVCILLWVTYLNDVLHTLLPTGQIFSAGKFIGFVVLIGWFGSQLVQGRARVRWGISGWLFLALLFQMFLSAGANGDFDADAFLLVITGLITYFLITNLLVERRDFDLFITHLIGIAALVALLGFIQAQQGDFLSRAGAMEQGIVRNPNGYALFLNIALPFALVGGAISRHWRLGTRMVAAFILLMVVITASRTGAVVAALTLIVLGLRYRSVRLVAVVGICVVVALSPYIPLIPHLGERVFNQPVGAQRGLSGRIAAIRVGIQMGLHNPLLGIGPSLWPDSCPSCREHLFAWVPSSPHNTYLQAFAELGFPGLVLLVTLLGMSAMKLWRLWHNRAEYEATEPWMWPMCALFLGYLVFIASLNRLYSRDLFIVLGLVEAYCNCVQRTRSYSHKKAGKNAPPSI